MAIEGLLSILNPGCIFVILIGVVIGIIFGSIPGLTSTMGVALCLPLTFSMSPLNGISMLVALYVGGTSGGLISAILLKIPGTPSSVATTFDGAPMAERGEGGKALGVGILYSFLGTILSIVALIFIAPSLAKIALKFGPYEYFAICLFALTMIGAMVGDNLLKGLMSGIAGVTFSLFGIASIGGALISLLTLGIPGDTVTAMILGGLTLHGIAPGPLLFKNSGKLVYGIFAAFLIATIIMLIVEYGGIRLFVKVLAVPKYILLPVVLVLCIVGTYGTNHNMFDVWTSLLFGVIGYFMMKHKFPQAPMILGFVLGTVVEENLIRGLMYSNNNFWTFFTSPIAAVFMILTVAMVAWTVYNQAKNTLGAKNKG